MAELKPKICLSTHTFILFCLKNDLDIVGWLLPSAEVPFLNPDGGTCYRGFFGSQCEPFHAKSYRINSAGERCDILGEPSLRGSGGFL